MLNKTAGRAVIDENYRILSTAIDVGIENYTQNKNEVLEPTSSAITTEVPPELTAALKDNAFIFSGWKAHKTMEEAGLTLHDEKGNLKSFQQFKQEAGDVFKKQKLNLNAEYRYASQTALSAAAWADIEADGDRYDLQYRTVGDDKVRDSHRQLDGTTLPPSDPFWSSYYPPNGWGCRCTAVQVRKGKYASTNTSEEAINIGNQQTDSPKLRMFRTNAGQTKKVFPRQHPNFPKGCEGCDKNVNLAFKPSSEACKACVIISECYKDNKKSEATKIRKHYLYEMEQLLKKKVVKNIGGTERSVGFRKDGNKHLYSDTFKRSKGLMKEDLKNLDAILENATFEHTGELSKVRKDNIKRFHYFKAEINGETVYLNVAETEFKTKTGLQWQLYFVYSVTDKIKK